MNPGPVETDRWENLLKKWSIKEGSPVEDIRRKHLARIPLGRFAKPKDIGSMVVFLASKEAAYLTGAMINLDGGMSMVSQPFLCCQLH